MNNEMYIDYKKDLSSERSVSLDNGNKLFIRKYDPYGFWRISYEHGQLPQKLLGQYTIFELALEDAKKYVAEKGLGVVDVQVTYQHRNH